MQYLGGKSATGKEIAAYIHEHHPDAVVWDACCGGLNVTRQLVKLGHEVVCSDRCEALIVMYQELQRGWIPPGELSKRRWQELKEANDPKDPLTAFAGFGCSFGGQWFAGYAKINYDARDHLWRSYVMGSANILLKDSRWFDRVSFETKDVVSTMPDMLPDGWVAYFDPPYRGTKGYTGTGTFDHDKFNRGAVELARSCPVYVSEYELPIGAVVFEKGKKCTVSRDKSERPRVERLYRI